ncbi:substrate-binding domain-containing protein [Tolypothrix sp. FACHB-123]|uniref:substrate-binding domain-containing protein n=1 Tax=Tolypothrix sp. FACHB-123 TaxID=2692868 RepID=UPI001684A25F|nr:substrate-binding domain-containing protein [Tolypothrix sp. FACHB-123]MBD2359089.1 substrate-binding domain-containing protein [Tolypothrix sp. FACHB-123]
MSSAEYFYQEYPCAYNAPLNCDRPFQTAQEIKGAKFCLECGFPATLPQEAAIKGHRDNYQVGDFLGTRGNGRLYTGIQLKDRQPVIIKEYLLPSRCFNEQETRERKETFKRVGGVTLADSRTQNFRLVNTWEAIADEKGERCYLITKGTETAQTLRQYITQNGAMTAPQVRELLNQALQTLEFLHSQKLRFPSNQVQQGLAHGNLSLDSILIQLENNQPYIYFDDLAIWENVFIPPAIPQPAPCKREQDLEALGLVAFYVWVGRTTNYSNQPIEPRETENWPNTDNHLKKFIYRLLRLENPFASAEDARQALLKLPQENHANNLNQLVESPEKTKNFRKKFIWLGIIAFLLLVAGIWYYLSSRRPIEDNSKFAAWFGLVRRFSEVNNVPSGKFTYTGEKDGTWSFILKQQIENQTIAQWLTNPKPEVKAEFNYQPVTSINLDNLNQSLEEVTSGQKNFAITSVVDQITDKLEKRPFADDGLLVYVAFNKKDSNLANALGGKITLEQLRQIYTGKITNWQQINPKLPNLQIKPYAPTEPEAIHKFQELVLQNDPQDKAFFNNVQRVERLDTTKTQNKIRSEILEGKQTGIIGFGILTKTWAQCTGYPLAIVDGNKPASQPLFQRRDYRPINTADDLCQHDNYFFDVKAFQSYPLRYPIFVVYPKDKSRQPPGSTFAEILTTRQGQCLLSKVGLVPLQQLPDDIKSYACKSVP